MTDQTINPEVKKPSLDTRLETIRERAVAWRLTAAAEGGLSLCFALNVVNVAGLKVPAAVAGGMAVYSALKSNALNHQADVFEAARYQADGTLPSFMKEKISVNPAPSEEPAYTDAESTS